MTTFLAVVVLTFPIWIWAFIIPYAGRYEKRRQLENEPIPRIITLAEKLDEETWALTEGWSPCDACGGPLVPR